MSRSVVLLVLSAALAMGTVTLTQASADTVDPITFDSPDALELERSAVAQTVQVLNQTNEGRRVLVSLGGASGQAARSDSAVSLVDLSQSSDAALPIGDLDQPLRTVVPARGSLSVRLRPDTSGKVFLTVTDLSSGLTIRRLLAVSDAAVGKPAVMSWKPQLPLWERADEQLGTLPLAPEEECGDQGSAPIPGTLLSGSDVLTISAVCGPDGFEVTAPALDTAEPGTYAGTLKVGDTDVAVEILKADPPWYALVALLLGIGGAVAARSLVGRRGIGALRRRIGQLPQAAALTNNRPEDEPGDLRASLERWTVRAAAERAATQQKLADCCADEALWPRWQRRLGRPLRYLFIPSPAALTKLDGGENSRSAAQAELAVWNEQAVERLTALHDLGARTPAARKLWLRAGDVVGDPDKGMRKPGTPMSEDAEQRSGTAGLAAVCQEATALLAAGSLATTLASLSAQVEGLGSTAPPTPGSPAAWTLRRAWLRDWAEARLSVDALQVELSRTDDAQALLADGYEARLQAASHLIDRLHRRHPDPAEAALAFTGEQQTLVAWPGWVVERVRESVRRASFGRSVLLGDLTTLVLAIVVVLATGMTSLYVGKAWGGSVDFAAAVLAGLAGTLALTPVFAAVDALGRGAQVEKSSAAS